MKFDFKNILLGVLIGIVGMMLIGDVDIQTEVQIGEKLDQADKDIRISIEKNIDENGKEIINVIASGNGSVTQQDVHNELEKIYSTQGIDISTENVNIEMKITK
tara:strand:+ start:103 stop:414 length:312 start_codon:yes stop_codon:yes gene_type:complete